MVLSCVGVCHIKLPVKISTALISPIALLKIIFSSEIIKDNFFCDFINVESVLIFHNSAPSFNEKHLKLFSKSVTKNLSSYIFTCELNGELLFFFQNSSPVFILSA